MASRISFLFCRKLNLVPTNLTKLQVANYRDPLMPHELFNHLEKRKEINLPDFESTQSQHKIKKLKRKQAAIWARYGSKSGISLKDLFPNEEEIKVEIEAEQEWWPTFQQLKMRADRKIENKKRKAIKREEKIADNMAKMPQWIAKWEADNEKERKVVEMKIQQRELNIVRSEEKKKELYLKAIKEKQQKKKRGKRGKK